MITQHGDSVTITGRPLLGAVYRSTLSHIAHRRANGAPSDDLRQLARLLYRAYMSPQRHEVAPAADDQPRWDHQQSRDDWVTTAEAANLLGLSRRSVQRLARAPDGLDAIRVGRTYMLRLAPVLALAKERRDRDRRTDGLSRELAAAQHETPNRPVA
jgi:excisionase family DNA binding protein